MLGARTCCVRPKRVGEFEAGFAVSIVLRFLFGLQVHYKNPLVGYCPVQMQCQKNILFFHMTGEQVMTLKCPLTSGMRASKQGLGIVIQFMSSAILVYRRLDARDI